MARVRTLFVRIWQPEAGGVFARCFSSKKSDSMSFLSSISWSQFLSFIIPVYVVVMAAIWFYYEKVFTGGASSQESEASRFAAKPLEEGDIPDDSEGFIADSDTQDEGNELLDDIVAEREKEIEDIQLAEVAQAKESADEKRRAEEGISREFDESGGFDTECEVYELEEEQKQFLYTQQYERFYTEQEYVESGEPQPDEDAYIPVEQTFGSEDDYLIATSELSFETMSDEQREMLEIADGVNDLARDALKNMQRGELPEETLSVMNDIYSGAVHDEDGEGSQTGDGDDFSQGFSPETVPEDMFGEKPMEDL